MSSTMSDMGDELNEVSHYGTLDGRRGSLEFSGHQWCVSYLSLIDTISHLL